MSSTTMFYPRLNSGWSNVSRLYYVHSSHDDGDDDNIDDEDDDDDDDNDYVEG